MESMKINKVRIAGFLFCAILVYGAGQIALAEQHGKTQKLCPVLGGEIDKSVYVDYQGKRVYFCCPGCIETFNKDPQRYIKKMESEGIVLEKSPQVKEAPVKKGGHGDEGHAGMRHGGQMHSN